MTPLTNLPPAQAVALVFAGILLSVFLPLAVNAIKKVSGTLEGAAPQPPPTFGQRLRAAWVRYAGNKYLALLVAGTLVAIVIVFLLGMQFFTARDAILAGFAWESLLNKLSR